MSARNQRTPTGAEKATKSSRAQPGRMEEPMNYKKQDIDRIFTETVAGLLAQGRSREPIGFQIKRGYVPGKE